MQIRVLVLPLFSISRVRRAKENADQENNEED